MGKFSTLVGSKSSFMTRFAFLAPQWWNELPSDIRTEEFQHIFHHRLQNCPDCISAHYETNKETKKFVYFVSFRNSQFDTHD